MLVCVFLLLFARETADAACIRHSPRPLISGRETTGITRAHGAARTKFHVWIGRHCEERSDEAMAVKNGLLVKLRHARACPGHPRLFSTLRPKDVDGRDKPGHDDA
jgi:hypothetical protein